VRTPTPEPAVETPAAAPAETPAAPAPAAPAAAPAAAIAAPRLAPFTIRVVKRSRVVVSGVPAGVKVTVKAGRKTRTSVRGTAVFKPALKRGTKLTVRAGAIEQRVTVR
jgi:hypothetical protein